MSLLPPINPGQFIKPSINVGAGFDILNGTYYRGLHGEEILSGGLSYIMGFVGKGNVFKSTMTEWMMYTAMARVHPQSVGLFYDTEFNKNETRMGHLQSQIKELNGDTLFNQGRFTLTDKAEYSGNKFFDVVKGWLEGKRKDKSNYQITPFVDRDGKSAFKMLVPTSCAYDSITEFDTDDIDTIRDKNEIGTGGQNIINMRAGLVKTNFLAELPRVTVQANNYTVMVAQIGKNMDISASPHAPPRQQLKNLPSSEAIKGATTKFTFATHDCWYCESSAPLLDDEKKPEYPIDAATARVMDQDLMLVKLKQLRSKGGPSGIFHEVLVSQKDGVLPSLTEFHYLRSRKRWGMDVSGGGGSIMELQLYPGIKVTRNTVRAKIDEDARYRRAINITMELKQMQEHWNWVTDEEIFVDPADLRSGLEGRGYDWNILLDTRGWWCVGENPIPYLSTMDLLNMFHGKYHPYWYEKVAGKEANAKVKQGPVVNAAAAASDVIAKAKAGELEKA